MGVIRLMLAVAVVVGHSGGDIFGFRLMGGRMAVESFFIISGFYMALVLNEKYLGKQGNYYLFITNRFLRIFPLYWLILLISFLFSIFVYLTGDKSLIYSTVFIPDIRVYLSYSSVINWHAFCLIIFTNIFIFLQDSLLFLQIDQTTGLIRYAPNFLETKPILSTFMFVPQAWSIALELMFYLIAPFILRRKLLIIVVIMLLLTALRMYLIYGLGLILDPWTYRFFPIELPFFLLGSVSYTIYRQLTNKPLKIAYLNGGFCFLVTLILFINVLSIPKGMYVYYLCFVILLPIAFIRTKGWLIDIYIGDLSYPVYLCHILLLAVIESLSLPILGTKSLTLIILSIVFSIALNELISKPIDRVRQKRVNKQKLLSFGFIQA